MVRCKGCCCVMRNPGGEAPSSWFTRYLHTRGSSGKHDTVIRNPFIEKPRSSPSLVPQRSMLWRLRRPSDPTPQLLLESWNQSSQDLSLTSPMQSLRLAVEGSSLDSNPNRNKMDKERFYLDSVFIQSGRILLENGAKNRKTCLRQLQ